MNDDTGIAAFCCSCGGTSDLSGVIQYLSADSATASIYQHPNLCSRAGIEFFTEKLSGDDAERVLVAGCASHLRQKKWEQALQSLGRSPHSLAAADCRLQSTEAGRTTSVAAAVQRLTRVRLPERKKISVVSEVMIVGAGLCGLRAAERLSMRGCSVILVDENGCKPSVYPDRQTERIIGELKETISVRENVNEIQAQVNEVNGYVGNFSVTLQPENGESVRMRVGAIVAAPEPEIVSGEQVNGETVIGLGQLAGRLQQLSEDPGEEGRRPHVAFLLDAGRERGVSFAAALRGALAWCLARGMCCAG